MNKSLLIQSLLKFTSGIVLVGLMLFLPAGSFAYWQGWLLMGILFVPMAIAGAVMLEVIVSYLGLGAQNAPSWGLMISDGQSRLWAGVWWEIGFASIALLILVLALNVLGDSLRDALDPKARR